jgi:Icc protein
VPVLVAPAVANETDVCAPHGTERAVRGSGFLVVDLLPDGSVRSTPVRVHDEHDDDEVFVLDEEAVRAIAAAAGAPAPA